MTEATTPNKQTPRAPAQIDSQLHRLEELMEDKLKGLVFSGRWLDISPTYYERRQEKR